MKGKDNDEYEEWSRKLSHASYGLVLVAALSVYSFWPDNSSQIWHSWQLLILILNAGINFLVCRGSTNMSIWFAIVLAFALSLKEYTGLRNSEYAVTYMYTGLCGSIAGIFSMLADQMKKKIKTDENSTNAVDSKDISDT